MSKDPDQEYFCDGITENIIAVLSHIPQLMVISRNSTFAYKDKSINVQQIGHELGAQYVIEGSLVAPFAISKAIDYVKGGNSKWNNY